MYDFLLNDGPDSGDLFRPGHDPALFHQGDYTRPLRMHRTHAGRLYQLGQPVFAIWPYLMNRIAQARMMRCAYDSLHSRGGDAPGPNGMRLSDLSDATAWSLCKPLALALRTGTYRPGPERQIQIPKGAGRGYRTLTLQNVEDRIVGKAILLVLQPVVDPRFSWFSIGFRPDRSPLQALAIAMALAAMERRLAWISADVANAFDAVPHTRLLDACGRLLPPDIVELVHLVSYTGKKRGCRQGSPLSPFLWNVFADRYIDGPFEAAAPGRLLRYADDLLGLCRNMAEAGEFLQQLTDLARSAGTPLKEGAEICDLGSAAPVDWLGYRVQRHNEEVAVKIAPRAWAHLEERLCAAHLVPASPLRALAIVRGWLDYLGPCYPYEYRRDAIGRIREIALGLGFDELPVRRELDAYWQRAYARWRRLYDRELKLLPGRVDAASVPATRQGNAGTSLPEVCATLSTSTKSSETEESL